MTSALIHKYEKGDRVAAATTMGWLKAGSVGVVTKSFDEGSSDPDALFRDEGDTVIVAWPKAAYLADPSGLSDPWNGTIMGIGTIDIEALDQPAYELPMSPGELDFIDNLLTK